MTLPAHILGNDLLATVDSHWEVITLTGRFLQYYQGNAKWLERTYTWVPRYGIDRIRSVVVDDAGRQNWMPERCGGPWTPTGTRGSTGKEPPHPVSSGRRCR